MLPEGRLDASETLRAEADGDLRITRLSDGHWLASRELADGSMIVVDDEIFPSESPEELLCRRTARSSDREK
ncbi:MAG: hypothetical protein KC731_11205 [Myxococcales bacterium]|nr:hypothetical protein [Myxococcales bacterium]